MSRNLRGARAVGGGKPDAREEIAGRMGRERTAGAGGAAPAGAAAGSREGRAGARGGRRNACEVTLTGVLIFWMSEGAHTPPARRGPGDVRESFGNTHARVAE